MTILGDTRNGLAALERRLHGFPVWVIASVIAITTYVAALLFVFPRYFEPLSPFHSDFFDYASKANSSGWDILTSAPRPIAYFAMYVLGHFGVTGLLAAEIPIVIGSILMVRWYIDSTFAEGPGKLWQFTIYAALVFSQQQFYFMYRHDLPFLMEFVFLLAALILWENSRSRHRVLSIAASVCFAFLSASSKETLYLAGPALLILPSLRSRTRVRQDFAAAIVLIVIEFVCHLRGGPFSGSLDATSPYYLDLSLPGLVGRLLEYVALLATPINAFVIFASVALAKNRALAVALVVTAFLALVPNSALPNHFFEEYAWSGMPFFVAPVLLQFRPIPNVALRSATAAILLALVLVGPKPTASSSWMIYQEKITSNIFKSVSTLALLPASTIILIVPPKDSPFAFWRAPSYVSERFPNHNRLEVLGPKNQPTPSVENLPVTYVGLDNLELSTLSYVAQFDDSGSLVSLGPIPKENCEFAEDAAIDSTLQTWIKGCTLQITDSKQALAAADAFVSVGAYHALRRDSQMFPDEASISKMMQSENPSGK